MTDYNTIEKLSEMHMTAMANAFRLQMNDSKMKDVSFEDRFLNLEKKVGMNALAEMTIHLQMQLWTELLMMPTRLTLQALIQARMNPCENDMD